MSYGYQDPHYDNHEYEYKDYGNHGNSDYEYELYSDHDEPDHAEPDHAGLKTTTTTMWTTKTHPRDSSTDTESPNAMDTNPRDPDMKTMRNRHTGKEDTKEKSRDTSTEDSKTRETSTMTLYMTR